MCYDYDAYLAKARIAELMRAKKPVAGETDKERGATAPAAPREPEAQDRERKPVPA
jgi:hypothetical protein